MRFEMSKNAKDFFDNIMSFEGAYSTGGKNKSGFDTQFDVYYCCALIGMAASQRDDDTSELAQLTEKYPRTYSDCKAQIAGLLVASEAKRQGVENSKLEELMLNYLSYSDTLLSDEGIKALNAYSLKGYDLMREYALLEKPTSREDFLEAFYKTIKYVGENMS